MRIATRITGLLVVLVMLGAPPGARATLSWRALGPVDASDGAVLADVSCPSTSLCAVVDRNGRALTVDGSGRTLAGPVVLEPTQTVSHVACPTSALCVATEAGPLFDGFIAESSTSTAVSFDPRAPAAGPATPIARITVNDVVCPSARECVAVGQENGCQSDEVTFTPGAAAASTQAAIDVQGGCPVGHINVGPPLAVACPSTSRCVAVDGQGQAIPFDPTAPGTPTPVTIDPQNGLTAVVCPSSTECVAVDAAGASVTFDPAAPASATRASLDSTPLVDLACPSLARCTALDAHGLTVSFTPGATPQPAAAPVIPGAGAAIDCPAVSACAVLDDSGDAAVVDPAAPDPGASRRIATATSLEALACPARCTAIDADGAAVTFAAAPDPAPGRTPLARATGTPTNGAAVTCPSASECVALAGLEPGTVLAFSPDAPDRVTRTAIPSEFTLTGLACPSVRECVLVDTGGEAIVLDPVSSQHSSAVVDATPGGLSAIACAASTQCTAVDANGSAVTFDPRSPGQAHRARIQVGVSGALQQIACPSLGQCTALADDARTYTFDPRDPRPTAGSPAPSTGLGPLPTPAGLACPTTDLCLTTDGAASVLTSDPSSAGGWTPQALRGADRLTAVACASYSTCVAVDSVGDAFLGTQAATPPRLTALAEAHRRWREARRPRSRAGRRTPLGTTFAFSLDVPATVTVTLTRTAPGRRVGASCRPRTRRNRGHRACRRTVVAARLTILARPGRTRVRFAGRLRSGRRLPAGTYRAAFAATGANGAASRPRTLTFAII